MLFSLSTAQNYTSGSLFMCLLWCDAINIRTWVTFLPSMGKHILNHRTILPILSGEIKIKCNVGYLNSGYREILWRCCGRCPQHSQKWWGPIWTPRVGSTTYGAHNHTRFWSIIGVVEFPLVCSNSINLTDVCEVRLDSLDVVCHSCMICMLL